MQSLGYSVLDTGDPLKAIQIVRAQPVDLLLTDVIMPLMKGTDLADRIQGVSPRKKVVLMSGYMTSDIAPTGRPFLRSCARFTQSSFRRVWVYCASHFRSISIRSRSRRTIHSYISRRGSLGGRAASSCSHLVM